MLEEKGFSRGGIKMDEITLRALAAKAGLSLDFVLKEFKLFKGINEMLSINQEYKAKLVLKGGTALNKVYLKGIQRFSEDVDMDYLSEESKEKKVSVIREIMKNVKEFSVEGPWFLRDNMRYHLGYLSFGKKDHIRFEFSLTKKDYTLRPIGTETMKSDITDSTIYGVPCYSLDDVVARKLNALRTRTEGKDVWDAYQAIPKTKKLKRAIGLALKSEGSEKTAKEAIEEMISKLKRADPKSLKKSTNPYIPFSLRLGDWEEVVFKVERMLREL